MEAEAERKIRMVEYCLYAYAAILIGGLIWNLIDGGIESHRDFIRGILRTAFTLFLAWSIWSLRKIYWWLISLFCIGFASLGTLSIVLLSLGIFTKGDYALLHLLIPVIPSTLTLAAIVFLMMQRDVRNSFVQ